MDDASSSSNFLDKQDSDVNELSLLLRTFQLNDGVTSVEQLENVSDGASSSDTPASHLCQLALNFDKNENRDAIMFKISQSITSEDLNTRLKSYELLSYLLVSKYAFMPPYIPQIIDTTMNTLQNDSEAVVKMSLEIWASLAEMESYLESNSAPHHSITVSNCSTVIPHILRILDSSSSKEDDIDTISKSGSLVQCAYGTLAAIVETIGFDVSMPLLSNFISNNISISNAWYHRKAAMMVLSVLTPFEEAETLFKQAIPIALLHSKQISSPHLDNQLNSPLSLRDAYAFFISNISDHYPELLDEHLEEIVLWIFSLNLQSELSIAEHLLSTINIYISNAVDIEEVSEFFQSIVKIKKEENVVQLSLKDLLWNTFNNWISSSFIWKQTKEIQLLLECAISVTEVCGISQTLLIEKFVNLLLARLALFNIDEFASDVNLETNNPANNKNLLLSIDQQQNAKQKSKIRASILSVFGSVIEKQPCIVSEQTLGKIVEASVRRAQRSTYHTEIEEALLAITSAIATPELLLPWLDSIVSIVLEVVNTVTLDSETIFAKKTTKKKNPTETENDEDSESSSSSSDDESDSEHVQLDSEIDQGVSQLRKREISRAVILEDALRIIEGILDGFPAQIAPHVPALRSALLTKLIEIPKDAIVILSALVLAVASIVRNDPESCPILAAPLLNACATIIKKLPQGEDNSAIWSSILTAYSSILLSHVESTEEVRKLLRGQLNNILYAIKESTRSPVSDEEEDVESIEDQEALMDAYETAVALIGDICRSFSSEGLETEFLERLRSTLEYLLERWQDLDQDVISYTLSELNKHLISK